MNYDQQVDQRYCAIFCCLCRKSLTSLLVSLLSNLPSMFLLFELRTHLYCLPFLEGLIEDSGSVISSNLVGDRLEVVQCSSKMNSIFRIRDRFQTKTTCCYPTGVLSCGTGESSTKTPATSPSVSVAFFFVRTDVDRLLKAEIHHRLYLVPSWFWQLQYAF